MEPGSVSGLAELVSAHVCTTLDPSADTLDRAQGELVVCGEVLRHLNTYVPYPAPNLPPELNAFGRMSHEERGTALSSPNVAQAFGAYRYAVTEMEGANATRLHVLCSTVQTLARLRAQAREPAVVDRTLETIGTWVERVWRVAPPLAGELRDWCRKQTWRPDVLPYAWRSL